MKSFQLVLTGQQLAQVDCPIDRIEPAIVRSALRDRRIAAPGSFIICFRVKEARKPLKPEAVPVSSIKRVVRYGTGLIGFELENGNTAYPTVQLDYSPEIVESLVMGAKRTAGMSRRLFCARVNEVLTLVEASEIYKAPKQPGDRPSRPSEIPDAG